MSYTDDPIVDAERYMEECEAWLDKQPKCVMCGTHIQDDFCFEILGELLCEKCMKENYQKETSDYVS